MKHVFTLMLLMGLISCSTSSTQSPDKLADHQMGLTEDSQNLESEQQLLVEAQIKPSHEQPRPSLEQLRSSNTSS